MSSAVTRLQVVAWAVDSGGWEQSLKRKRQGQISSSIQVFGRTGAAAMRKLNSGRAVGFLKAEGYRERLLETAIGNPERSWFIKTLGRPAWETMLKGKPAYG